MKVCRICLSKDGRLYPITSNGLRSLYHQLTGLLKLEMDVDKRLPQWVCAECGLRLMSYNKLRQKSLRAHQILTQLLDRVTNITEEDIDQIDRDTGDLKSNFNYSAIQVIEGHQSNIEKTVKTDCKLELDTKMLKTEITSECDILSDPDMSSDDDNSPLTVLKYKSLNLKSSLKKTSSEKVKLNTESLDKYLNTVKKNITKRTRKNVVKKSVSKKMEDNATDPMYDLFTIQSLSSEEQMAEFEKRKNSPKYINAPFQCDQCFNGFSAEETYFRHQLTHTDKWGKFECKICKRRFRNIHSYCDHMRSHKTIFSCKQCNFKTGVRQMAKMHRSKHRGTVYECPHCDLKFVNNNSYLLHVRVKHVSQFACEFCGFSFVNAKGVNLHKKLKHTLQMETDIVTTDGPTCATCNIKFVSDEALSTHLGVAHPQHPDFTKRNDIRIIRCSETKKDGKVYPCRVCGKVLTTRSNRSRHMIIHTGLRPFLCETCGSSFKTKGEVKAHTEHVHMKVPWPRKQARSSRQAHKDSFV